MSLFSIILLYHLTKITFWRETSWNLRYCLASTVFPCVLSWPVKAFLVFYIHQFLGKTLQCSQELVTEVEQVIWELPLICLLEKGLKIWRTQFWLESSYISKELGIAFTVQPNCLQHQKYLHQGLRFYLTCFSSPDIMKTHLENYNGAYQEGDKRSIKFCLL